MLRIYKSSAGSGKTYTLVKEYLRLALSTPATASPADIKYKRILAITFTNKAAAEMKSRILEALEGIAKADTNYTQLTTELSEATGKTESQLQQSAGLTLKSMLHNYSDISVSTIDSFVHRIVRAFAHDLHLPMNFDIEMDANKLLHDAVDMLLDKLDESDEQVTQAVLEFAETKIEDGKSWNIDFEIQKLGKELFVDEALPYVEQLGLVDFAQMREAKSALYAQMKSFEQKIFAEGKKSFQLILDSGLTAKDFYQGTKGVFGYFNSYADEKFPSKPEGNSYVVKCLAENDWGKKDMLDEGIKHALEQSYQRILHWWGSQGKEYYLADLLLKNFYSFILLADLQKLLSELKQDNNILHIGDFHHKVFEIVKEQDAPIIYERIGERYDNILIDEFQDTSLIQWRNLLPLVENSQFKNEDSLIVGDGKQAIYRFRGGEVEQFSVLPKIYGSDQNELLKQREVAVNNYGTEVELLESNYRSRKEVIDFNNALYKEMLSLPELSNKQIYEDYYQKHGNNKSGGFVNIEFLKASEEQEKHLDDARCERIEEIIHDTLQRGYSYKDIAVLTRSNNTASIIASHLVQKGIRVISPESLLIHQSQKVKLLLAAFNYLHRKDNHIARAEMLYYTQLLLGTATTFEKIDFSKHDFEEAFRKETETYFNSSELSMGRLADLTQQLIRAFKLNDDDPFLQFFLDEILLYSSRYGNSIGDFLVWWEGVRHKKSIVYPESMDAVHIMTIHKSKGLQFPVVILADASGKMKTQKNYFWVPLNKKDLPQLNIGILPCNKQVEQTEFASLYKKETEQSFLDMLNLLYVGTTRPEDALYILSEEPDNEPTENNSVTALLVSYLRNTAQWNGFRNYSFGEKDFQKQNSGKQQKEKFATYEKKPTQSSNLLASSIKVKMKAGLLWSNDVTGKIDAGNLLHEALKQVKYEGDEEIVVARLKAEGAINGIEKAELLDKVKLVVYHKELNRYFKKGLQVITERPLLKATEKVKIPDRVIIENGEAVLLDYKTGKERIEHQQQQKEYGLLLEEVGLRVKQKILFYTRENKVENVK